MTSGKRPSKIRPRDRPPSVTHQVAEHLARLILSGTLAPGEKLPGETVLARRLGVSRPTLREAVRELQQRELVEIRPRSGTYVRAPAPRDAPSLLDGLLSLDPSLLWELLEIRRIIDPASAALAARRRTPAELALLREVLRSTDGFSGEQLVRFEHSTRLYGRFFSLLAEASHNRLFSRLAEGLAGRLRDALAYSRLRLSARPAAAEVIRGQLVEILEAVEAGDGSAAQDATLEHLEFVETALRELEGPS